MSEYSSLAPLYDRLTADVDYQSFLDFYHELFQESSITIRSVVDLACGTGTLTGLMAKNGYDMTGTDASTEMLSVARDKHGDDGILFLNQQMEELDLYGTVDAAICSLDGMNYAVPENLDEIFRRIFLFLEPEGMFVFDINSPKCLMELDGEMFVDEDDSVYCVWRAEFDSSEMCCFYGMDIFEKQGHMWQRYAEEHVEYAHTPDELCGKLSGAGFTDIRVYGDRTLNPPEPDEKRIFISAKKPKI